MGPMPPGRQLAFHAHRLRLARRQDTLPYAFNSRSGRGSAPFGGAAYICTTSAPARAGVAHRRGELQLRSIFLDDFEVR